MQSQPFSMCWDFYLWAEQMIFFRRNKKLCRFIAVLLMFTSAAVPFHVIAAEVKLAEIGKQAQSFGNMALGGMELGSESGGELYFPNVSEPITINDLYPSTSGQSSLPASKFFADAPDVEGAKAMYDSGTAMTDSGESKQAALWSDAMSDDPSIYGSAYKLILDAKKYARPDFSNDPMFNQSQGIYDNMDLIAQGFGDCTTEDTFSLAQREIHMPDYKMCERVKKPKGACEIEHIIKVDPLESDVLFLVDNSGSMDSVIRSILNSVQQFSMLLGGDEGKVRMGGLITRSGYTGNKIAFTPDSAQFRNWVSQIRINSGATYVTDAANYALNTYTFRDDVQKVVVIIGNQDAPGGDYGALRARFAAENIKAYIFHDNAQTRSLGTHVGNVFTADGLFRVAQMLTVVEDQWTPKQCVQDAIATLEEFCQGDYEVTQAASPCSMISGFRVCPGDPIEAKIKAPPLPNVNKLDSKIYVSPLVCDFNVGSMGCWVDANGNQQCPTNDGASDSCEALEDNPQCGFISSQCLTGAQGSKGTCYAYEEKWDCGTSVAISDVDKSTEYQCSGTIKCMGADCIDIESTKNGDFSKAASLLHAAQHMAGDMTCNEGSPGEGGASGSMASMCQVFKGTSSECKKALGGTVDCCEAPDGVNFGDYLSMLTNMPKIDTAIMSISDTSMFSGVKSGYAYLRDPVVSSFKQVTSPFTSYIDSVTGAVDALKSTATDLLNKLTAKAQEIMIESLRDIGLGGVVEGGGGAAAGEVVADQGAAAVGEGLGAAMGSVISFIGWVYLIYQVAMLIIQIIYKCTKEELTLGVDRELKKCTFVGSYCASKFLGSCIEKREAYCCFPSPLARIILEEGNKQLGKTFGEGEAPQCDGLTMEEIGKLDWDRMNLDEWVGMLKQHDLFHDASTIGLDKLTGAGTTLDIQDGKRLNALERAFEREKGTNIDEQRLELSRSYDPSTGSPTGD